MKMNDFFRSTFKVAVALFIAVIALSVAGWGVWKAQDTWAKHDAKQYEVIKPWPVDLKENLQMTLLARTKLIDGRLMAEVNLDGFPAYLSDPQLQAKNRNAGITLIFQDKDGFKLHSKPIEIREFTSRVDAKGAKYGLRYEFDDYMTPETYARFSGLQVAWNLETVLPAMPISVPSSNSSSDDHCAPNLIKTERLKRLAMHGTLRETGSGDYSAGGREVMFNTYDGSLVYCR